MINAQVGCQNPVVEAAYAAGDGGSEARQTPGRDARVRRYAAKPQKSHGGRRQTDRAKTADKIGGWVNRGAAAKRRKSSPDGTDEEGVSCGGTQGSERAAAGPASPKNPNGLDRGAQAVSVAAAFPLARGGSLFCLIPAAAGDILILY